MSVSWSFGPANSWGQKKDKESRAAREGLGGVSERTVERWLWGDSCHLVVDAGPQPPPPQTTLCVTAPRRSDAALHHNPTVALTPSAAPRGLS